MVSRGITSRAGCTDKHKVGTIAIGELAKNGARKTIHALSGSRAGQGDGISVASKPAGNEGVGREGWHEGRDEARSSLAALVDDERMIVFKVPGAVVYGAFNKRRRAVELTAARLKVGSRHPFGGQGIGGDGEDASLAADQRRQKGGSENDCKHGESAQHKALNQSTGDLARNECRGDSVLFLKRRDWRHLLQLKGRNEKR